jgi:hypothetical protein
MARCDPSLLPMMTLGAFYQLFAAASCLAVLSELEVRDEPARFGMTVPLVFVVCWKPDVVSFQNPTGTMMGCQSLVGHCCGRLGLGHVPHTVMSLQSYMPCHRGRKWSHFPLVGSTFRRSATQGHGATTGRHATKVSLNNRLCLSEQERTSSKTEEYPPSAHPRSALLRYSGAWHHRSHRVD